MTYYRRRAVQHLENLEYYRASLDYLKKLRDTGHLNPKQTRVLQVKLRHTATTIKLIEHSLSELEPREHSIIEKLYLRHEPFEEVCEDVALERSSVYRYRQRGLDKIARRLFAADMVLKEDGASCR